MYGLLYVSLKTTDFKSSQITIFDEICKNDSPIRATTSFFPIDDNLSTLTIDGLLSSPPTIGGRITVSLLPTTGQTIYVCQTLRIIKNDRPQDVDHLVP